MTEPKLIKPATKLVEIQLCEDCVSLLGTLYCPLADWDRVSIILKNLAKFYTVNGNSKYTFKGLRQ